MSPEQWRASFSIFITQSEFTVTSEHDEIWVWPDKDLSPFCRAQLADLGWTADEGGFHAWT